MTVPRKAMLLGLLWVFSSSALSSGCTDEEPASGPSLSLSFASQPVSAGCPEVPIKGAAPSALKLIDELDVRLYLPDGTQHFQKLVRVDKLSAKISGIKPPPSPDEFLRLEVLGRQAGTTVWIGGAEGVSVSVGSTSQVNVLMTAGGRTSCLNNAMPFPKAFAASVALLDGKILLAGGVNQVLANPDGSKELLATKQVVLFDPTTGISTVGTQLSVARALATATLLENGNVLVVGGASRVLQKAGTALPFTADTADLVPSYEIYRPDKTWTERPLSGGRVFHNAIRLQDGSGKVLITGGGQDLGTALNLAMIYDANTDQMLPIAARMQAARLGHAAALLSNGHVLLIGGAPDNGAAVEEFVPNDQDGAFGVKTISGPALNLFFAGVVALASKPDQLFLGGGALLSAPLVLAEPAKDNTRVLSKLSDSAPEAKPGGPLAEGHFMPAFAHLGKDRLFIGGGFSDLGKTPSATLEQWDLATDTWALPVSPDNVPVHLTDPRAGAISLPFVGDRLLFLGGLDADRIRASGEAFTPKIEEAQP